jgi:hypothetical protein
VIIVKSQRGDQSPEEDYETSINNVSVAQDLLFPVIKYRKGFIFTLIFM